MKHALISPNETTCSYDGTELGQRVAQVENVPFDIVAPMFWVECNDDVVADQFYFDPDTQQFIAKPSPPEADVTITQVPGGPTIIS